MSRLSIDDLPSEIIDIIFSYFNAPELNYIKNAPQFEAYAYRQLYSTVVIGNIYNYLWFTRNRILIPIYKFRSLFLFPFTGVYGSCKNASELIDIIENHPTVKPKQIFFLNPQYLIKLHEKKPDILKDVEIGISFEWNREYDKWDDMVQKLMEMPYTFYSLRYLVESENALSWDQIKRLTSGTPVDKNNKYE
ncbi:hypothetical protein K6H11_004170 [Candida tropicalis]